MYDTEMSRRFFLVVVGIYKEDPCRRWCLSHRIYMDPLSMYYSLGVELNECNSMQIISSWCQSDLV